MLWLKSHDIKSRRDNMAECCADCRKCKANVLKCLLGLALQIARTNNYAVGINSPTGLNNMSPPESLAKALRIVKIVRHRNLSQNFKIYKLGYMDN